MTIEKIPTVSRGRGHACLAAVPLAVHSHSFCYIHLKLDSIYTYRAKGAAEQNYGTPCLTDLDSTTLLSVVRGCGHQTLN